MSVAHHPFNPRNSSGYIRVTYLWHVTNIPGFIWFDLFVLIIQHVITTYVYTINYQK